MALNKDNNAQNQRDHTSTEEQEFNNYHRLPHELRHMIRQIAIKDREQSYLEARDDLTRRALPHVHINSLRPYIRPEDLSLAALACVDKEWQEDVEKQLFKQLVLFKDRNHPTEPTTHSHRGSPTPPPTHPRGARNLCHPPHPTPRKGDPRWVLVGGGFIG